MRTVRDACFAALIGIFAGAVLPSSYVGAQESTSESAPAPAVQTSSNGQSKPKAAKKRDKASAGKTAGPAKSANDRLNLDATKVVGNRELPKVLYIVPWKRSDLGELPGQPINSLLDEVLAPLDRDEYRREIRYYQAIVAPGDKRTEGAPDSLSKSPSQSIPTEK